MLGYSQVLKMGVENDFRVSHLQFADDTLIMGETSFANIRVIKANILLFELMPNLKVNFHNISLVGVNVD